MGLLVRNGLLVTEEGIRKADLLIENEKISRLEPNIEEKTGDQVIDAGGKYVLPGVIDAHVHYHMKTAEGRTADSFETGSLSAAFGGVTSYIDFASPVEGKSLLEALKERQNEAAGHSYLDYSFHMEITGEFEQDVDELPKIKSQGITSLKIYTTYGSTQLLDPQISALLKKAREESMLVMVHAEDDNIISRRKQEFIATGKVQPRYHAASRPEEAEIKAIGRLVEMAEAERAALYIAHVSTGKGAQIIRRAKAKGESVYGETCPHYLLLSDECYNSEESQKYIMTPPLRKREDQEALWQSLSGDTLQCIATDHCAFHLRDKLKSESCFDVLPGIGGSETLLPLMYSEGVAKGRISLVHLVRLLSSNPARIFGLYPQKGALMEGSDGDVVIFDPGREVVLKGSELHSASGYTVFEGMKLKGYPAATLLRGKVLCMDGMQVAEKPEGIFVKANKE